jgi:DNA-binding MarR family transcriptional regulator
MSREKAILVIVDLIRQNQVLNDFLDQAAADYLGINRTDANAIDVIDRYGRITAGELARELRLSTGAITAVVDRLERAGYARRVADPDDRRRVLLEITPVVQENGERIYGRPEDGFTMWKDFSDADMDVVRRFQEMSRRWLEDRLAKLDELVVHDASDSKLPPRKRQHKKLRGRGRA